MMAAATRLPIWHPASCFLVSYFGNRKHASAEPLAAITAFLGMASRTLWVKAAISGELVNNSSQYDDVAAAIDSGAHGGDGWTNVSLGKIRRCSCCYFCCSLSAQLHAHSKATPNISLHIFSPPSLSLYIYIYFFCFVRSGSCLARAKCWGCLE